MSTLNSGHQKQDLATLTMTGKRKYDSGSEKRKNWKRKELVIQSFVGPMDRYVTRKPIPSITNEDNLNEDVDANDDYVNTLNEKANGENENANADGENEHANADCENEHANCENENVNGESENENVNCFDKSEYGLSNSVSVDDLSDPGNWKAHISQKERDLIVEIGPVRVAGLRYPVDKKRSFSDRLYTRCLANGEKYDRPWLVYSPSKNKVFCFCCVLFNEKISSPLTSSARGNNDWHHIHTRLVEHEKSNWHVYSMKAWREAELRLKKGNN